VVALARERRHEAKREVAGVEHAAVRKVERVGHGISSRPTAYPQCVAAAGAYPFV